MNITVSIPPELNAVVEAQLKSGRFNSVSDVLCGALRLLQQSDQDYTHEVAYLKNAWDKGKSSGIAEPFDMEDIKIEGRRRLEASNNQLDIQ
jgi:antitoxin ParD1/3/4